MPNGRRPSKHTRPVRPLSTGSSAALDHKRDGGWVVRTVTASGATKEYRCPGCQQVIPAGTAHVVVWPHEPSFPSQSPVSERRHWHTSCWRRRG